MENKYTNDLINEQSPYLLLHAHNPVNWMPWGDEALQRAKDENKLLLISIGYAACHWCHVMEHESFADETVAKLMNEYFISVKVDREERPDIDQIYMDAAHVITGQGGWPLNAIALPDGRPVYAGTYFPKANWMDLLTQINGIHINTPQKLLEQAEAVAEGISKINNWTSADMHKDGFSTEIVDDVWQYWQKNTDPIWGGANKAPKFPLPCAVDFLLEYSYFAKSESASQAVILQLDRMANGGIFDHLAGGFARYSTDEKWHVPHFEKMLYDNAQLASTYTNAYKAFGKELYKKTAEQTADFIIEALSHPDGGFYSALDADTEGEEGLFYVWSKQEIDNLLGENAQWFCDYFDITERGNWEPDRNVLWKPQGESGAYIVSEKLDLAIQTLLNARNKRTNPAVDDKMIATWNAMAVSALADVSSISQKAGHFSAAVSSAEFLFSTFIKEGTLFRNFKQGGILKTYGFLDDYAFTIQAFIKIFQLTFDAQWLLRAESLANDALRLFDSGTPLLYYTSSEHENLSSRKKEIHDNVIPSANSVMAHNLFLLSHITGKDAYIEISEAMLKQVSGSLVGANEYLSSWARLYQLFAQGCAEVYFAGPDLEDEKTILKTMYFPNAIISGNNKNEENPFFSASQVKGKDGIYVCIDRKCSKPVVKANEVAVLINKERHY